MTLWQTRSVRLMGAFIILGLFLAYVLFQARFLIAGPIVFIETPQSGSTVEAGGITITGEAKRISHLSLNGRPIHVDESGRFSERLLVPEGYTIITLTARDRFGRERDALLHLYARDNSHHYGQESSESSPLSRRN